MTVEATPRAASRLSVLGWILLAAVLVRVLYLAAYVTRLPFAYGPVGDSVVYLQQARDVLSGHLGSPALLAFSPLYGYVLALLSHGEASVVPLVVQLALGVINIFLMHRLTRSLFGEWAAVAAAALMLGYGTLLFLESKLLTETLALTLLLLGLRSYVSASFRAAAVSACIGTGALIGLAVLTRASMLFCIPGFVVCALMPWALDDGALKLRLRRALLLALGALAILGANGAINLHHSGVFVPVIMVSRTLETASRVEWKGSFEAFAHDGRQASPLDVVEQAAQRLREGPTSEPSLVSRLGSLDLGGIAAGVPRKWALTFANRESFQEYGFLGERAAVAILRWLPVSFGTIALLALFGCVAVARQGQLRALWPLLPAILGTLATTALYHPSSRYRLALVVPLLALAGLALDHVRRLPSGRARAAWGFAMLAAVAFTTADWFRMGAGNRPAWHVELAVSAYTAGEYEAAAQQASLARQMTQPGSAIRRRAELVLARTRPHLEPRPAAPPPAAP